VLAVHGVEVVHEAPVRSKQTTLSSALRAHTQVAPHIVTLGAQTLVWVAGQAALGKHAPR